MELFQGSTLSTHTYRHTHAIEMANWLKARNCFYICSIIDRVKRFTQIPSSHSCCVRELEVLRECVCVCVGVATRWLLRAPRTSSATSIH